MADRLEERDYLAEPDYDRLTDEQLDELYYFGELRTPGISRKASRKSAAKGLRSKRFDDSEEGWFDLNLESDNDPYED